MSTDESALPIRHRPTHRPLPENPPNEGLLAGWHGKQEHRTRLSLDNSCLKSCNCPSSLKTVQHMKWKTSFASTRISFAQKR